MIYFTLAGTSFIQWRGEFNFHPCIFCTATQGCGGLSQGTWGKWLGKVWMGCQLVTEYNRTPIHTLCGNASQPSTYVFGLREELGVPEGNPKRIENMQTLSTQGGGRIQTPNP